MAAECRDGERLARRMGEARGARGWLAALLLVCAALALWVGLRGDAVVQASAAQAEGMRLVSQLDSPDQVCASCHQAIYDSYERTPMAMGSGLAAAGLDDAELKAGGFRHAGSGVKYRVALVGGVATLTYERDGAQRLAGEERLRYFVGSGRRGRTFLYDTDGLWFETPINWYTRQGAWDMAPGFSAAVDLPAPLPVDANCLHCHASEMGVAAGGARNRFAGAPFGQGGVGCAACHGDAQAHLALVRGAGTGGSGMLNLKRLQPVERDSVCLQCHLEGDATVYRAGRSLAGFKPGESLFASAVYFVDRNRTLQGGRASSQYEALLESACKRGAGDKLTCTTCHDPHSSPAPAERVEFFRERCLSCHSGTAMATTHHPEQRDCATCHMPTRATLDISHEQVTDHNIQAKPRLKARAEERTKAFDLVPVGPASVGVREEGLAYAQLAQHGDRTAGERALQLLRQAEKTGSDDAEVHDQLGFLLQVSGARSEAAAEYAKALSEAPQDTTAAANLAVLSAAGGHVGTAVGLLEQVVKEDPSQTAAGLNLAFLLCKGNEKVRAREIVGEMLRFNPGSSAARMFLDKGVYGGQSCDVR